jgi:hypothetical protein
MLAIIRMLDIRHVGTCPRCMRISFLAMTSSWIFTLGLLALGFNATFLIAISIVLTLLWVAHVVRRTTRSTHSHQPQDNSRRLAFRLALALIGSAAISVAFRGKHEPIVVVVVGLVIAAATIVTNMAWADV